MKEVAMTDLFNTTMRELIELIRTDEKLASLVDGDESTPPNDEELIHFEMRG